MNGEERLTLLLQQAADGNQEALGQAVAAVHQELERVARRQGGHYYGAYAENATLEPAALVNETFLRLLRQRTRFQNRSHFFAVATRVMFRALANHERSRQAEKRGGGRLQVTLGGLAVSDRPTMTTILDLSTALDKLQAMDEDKADVVRLKLIWGFTHEEIAKLLERSVATIERHWRFARVWLQAALEADVH